MPTRQVPTGRNRNLVWRAIQLPTSIFFRIWAPLKVEGLEHIDPDQPGLIVSNHQSFLDPLMLAVRMARPISYLARDGLFKIPFIGWVLRNTYVMPISRKAARAASIRAALERLEEGFLVGIFPEGTRQVGDVADFRPGVTAVLKRSSVPVYPVGIAGADRIWPKGSWFIRPGRIRVVFGPPIPREKIELLSKAESKAELAEYVRDQVVELQRQAREK